MEENQDKKNAPKLAKADQKAKIKAKTPKEKKPTDNRETRV